MESEYSIHLSALDGSEGSSATLQAQQHIDEVRSEDIDGPSDFTENMIAYLKGDGFGNDDNVTEEMGGPPGCFENPADFDDASSIWEPYNEGQTPHILSRLKRLQPTVEDYESPSRIIFSQPLPSRTSSISGRSHEPVLNTPYNGTTSDQNSEKGSRSSPSTPVRPSSRRASPAESPSSQKDSPVPLSTFKGTDDTGAPSAALLKELEEMRARCGRLEVENAKLTEALEEEKCAHLRTKVEHEGTVTELNTAILAQGTEKAKGIEALKQAAKKAILTEKSKHEGTISALKTTIQVQETEKAKEIAMVKELAENMHLQEKTEYERTISTLKTTIEVQEAEKAKHRRINDQMDAQMDAMIAKQKATWRSKVASLEKEIVRLNDDISNRSEERRVMAKELMRAWGKLECGDDGDGPQRYRYKYVKRGTMRA